MTEQSQPLFLFGPGYSARALAAIWAGPVFAGVRPGSLEKYRGDPLFKVGSLQDQAWMDERLPEAHLLISAAPDDEGCPALRTLGSAAGAAASVTYLSTTGVYGDLRGGWAMEWSEVQPGSERSHRRVEAEMGWLALRPDVRIVRLPGIYGPGRSPLDRVREGRARRIVKPGQVFSRIHVDDIAGGVKALIDHQATGIFNLCDEEAAPPQDVTAFAADLLGLDVPPEVDIEDADLSPMARSFYAECKRVSNAKVKAATGWRPRFPTYREGLTTIAEAGG